MCEDKVLVELNKEQCQTGFAVGDIYLGKVRKIMPGLNAAFVNIGHEKDAFIHYLIRVRVVCGLLLTDPSRRPGRSANTSRWGSRSWSRWPRRPFRPKVRA